MMSQDVETFKEVFAFFRKTTPYGKIFKILFRKLSSPYCSTCCVQISWYLADEKWAESCVAYLTAKNKSSLCTPAVATARIAPKICQGKRSTFYSECSKFHPNRFTFGGVIAERVNTAITLCKVNLIFGWSLASSRILSLFVKIAAVNDAALRCVENV